MKKQILKRNLIVFLIMLLSSVIVFILIMLERPNSQENENQNITFQKEYEAYLKASKKDFEESPVSSSSFGPRAFKHLHNIAKLGPMVLPYLMQKVTQTKDMSLTHPVSIITRKRFSKSEWPEGTYGDSRTLTLLYIDWWEKGRNLTPQQFTERYA